MHKRVPAIGWDAFLSPSIPRRSSYNTEVNASIEANLQRAAAATCRDQSPQLFLAAHLLPRALRADALTLRAVLHQLHTIMFTDDDEGGCCQGQPAGPFSVCHAVLDHLWTGEPTGKDELNGFAALQQQYDLPRERFDRIINGWQGFSKVPRIATWSRFRELHDRANAPMIDLLLSLLGEQLEDTSRLQVESIALAMSVAHVLNDIGHALKRGVVPLPLDDLVRFGIHDHQLINFANQQLPGDQRWCALVDHEVNRALTLLHGGAKATAAINHAATRRALAVLVRGYQMWLMKMARHAEDLMTSHVELTRFEHFRAMAGVYTAKPALKRACTV